MMWIFPLAETCLKGIFPAPLKKAREFRGAGKSGVSGGLWQRRFWEHLLRDQADLTITWITSIGTQSHGWVKRVADWPHSSFHRYVAEGIYPTHWGDTEIFNIRGGE
jgi:putative transposase